MKCKVCGNTNFIFSIVTHLRQEEVDVSITCQNGRCQHEIFEHCASFSAAQDFIKQAWTCKEAS